MKKLKLSQWHDGNVKPVHIGVYERTFNNPHDTKSMYCKWNGNYWCVIHESVEDANKENYASIFLCKYEYKWRGVLK